MVLNKRNLIILSIANVVVSLEVQSTDCYVSPSCTATEFYNPVTGFTNDTGFAFQGSNECCQICLPGTSPTVCFDETDLDCKSKIGNGDYDYVLFDQIWLPEFCQSLSNGFDPTLTHLEGSLCLPPEHKSTPTSSKLSIHGMWPNYVNGYPQCCDIEGGTTTALLPEEVVQWSSWPELQEQWPDRTVPTDSPCAVCLMLNHEWLKHGGCYSPGDPEKYFTDALNLHSLLSSATSTINNMAGLTVTTKSIEQLYPKNINVICDTNANSNSEDFTSPEGGGRGNGTDVGMFLELRTCWSRDKEPIDCPAAFSGAFGAPCPEYTHLLA